MVKNMTLDHQVLSAQQPRRVGFLALSLCAVIFSGFGVSDALAQEEATTIANPGRVQERLQRDDLTPTVSPNVEVKDAILQAVPEGADQIKFNLTSIQLDGVTVYSEAELMPVYQDKLGTDVSLADIYVIATALTNNYRNDGYILTQVVVPPQTIEAGIVRLQVVEGFIDGITIEGEEDQGALDLIESYASRIRTGRALNIRDMERYLLLINDLPGLSARSVLSPSPTLAGAADLQIIITRDYFDALVAADNYGSRFLGPVQFTTAAGINSMFGQNERVAAQFVYAPGHSQRELAYFDLSYEMPIFSHGTKVQLFASRTHTEPGFGLGVFGIKGRSEFYSVQVSHPFIRSRTENLTAYAIADHRNLESSSILSQTVIDRIRAARAGARYEFLDTLFGVGINAVNVEIAQGLDVFGASEEGGPRLTRTEGDPQFFKVNVNAQRLQRVTNSVNLLVAARGQMSNGPLLSSEEFGIGGMSMGRGYDSSELVGDEGLAGQIEVQWNEPHKFDSPYIEDYQLFSFYDVGSVWQDDFTTIKQKRDTLASAGFGARFDFAGDIDADLTVAFPLNRDVQTENDEGKRVFIGLSKKF
jgi:hemolysin activation/secretion protein